MSTTPLAIDLQSIDFTWSKQRTLSNVSLQLQAGHMLGLLGPNGAGKTTLISLIAGLIQPDSGQVNLLGQTIATQQANARRQLGFVFQSVSLDRFLTVRHNLEYAAGLQGLNSSRTTECIEQLCELFPISSLLKKPAGALSGGQRRIVDIARAMVHNPSILILDEPTTALDPHAKQQVWQQLVKLKNTLGKSILVATHLMDEAADCDEIALLMAGSVKWQGTPEQALSQLPDQSLTTTRNANLTDWFIWKTQADAPQVTKEATESTSSLIEPITPSIGQTTYNPKDANQ